MLATSLAQAQTAPEWFSRGQQSLVSGDYAEATSAFRAALARNPDYPSALLGLAEALLAQGELSGVEELLNRASALREESVRILLLRAELALGGERLEDARTHVVSAQQREPDAAEPWFLQARIDLATGQEVRALGSLDQALSRQENHRPSLLSRALIGSEIGDPSTSQWLSDARRYWPDHPDTQRVSALVGVRSGNLEQARADLDAALLSRPRDTQLRILAAGLQLQMGDFTEARTTAERALTQDPNLPEAWYLAALAAELDGDTDRADQRYRQALNVATDDEVLRLLVEQQVLGGRPLDDPIRGLLADHHLNLARSYRDRNLTQRALERYRRALQLQPGLQVARLERAELLRLRGLESTYTAELEVVSRQDGLDPETARNVATQLEIYGARVSRGVAADWGVDQFVLERPRIRLMIIPEPDSLVALPGRANALAGALANRLNRSESVAAETLPAVSDPVAAIRASQGRADFLIIFSLSESDPVRASARVVDLSSAATRATLGSTRSGLDRVDRVLADLSTQILSDMPLPLRLLDRRGDRGLISAGLADGLVTGQRLRVVTAPRPAEFPVPDESSRELGTAEITALDDLVSEVVIAPRGLVDRVRAATALLPISETSEDSQSIGEENVPSNAAGGVEQVRPEPSAVSGIVASLRQSGGATAR